MNTVTRFKFKRYAEKLCGNADATIDDVRIEYEGVRRELDVRLKLDLSHDERIKTANLANKEGQMRSFLQLLEQAYALEN